MGCGDKRLLFPSMKILVNLRSCSIVFEASCVCVFMGLILIINMALANRNIAFNYFYTR